MSLNSVGEKFPPLLLSGTSGENLQFCAVCVRMMKSDIELPGSAVIRTDATQSL